MSTNFEVEVVYALPQGQSVVRLSVAEGTTVREVIVRSSLLEQFPEIDLSRNAVGVWGRLARLEQRLRPRDRVEIYRPLSVDPKQARRLRASTG